MYRDWCIRDCARVPQRAIALERFEDGRKVEDLGVGSEKAGVGGACRCLDVRTRAVHARVNFRDFLAGLGIVWVCFGEHNG